MTKLKLGDKVLCTNDNRRRWWKKGKVYEVTKTETTNKLIVIDEDGDRRDVRIIENYLNKGLALNFELVKEKYTENDLELGDKLLCTKSEVDHWISGKMYELKLNKLGVLEIKDEDGDEAYSRYILECLNKEWDLVEFELIKKEENKMQEFKVGDLVEVVKNNSHAYKNKSDFYQVGDKAIVTEVSGLNVRIGDNKYGNLISKHEIKKVVQSPELTEYEEELVLRLAEAINRKDNYLTELENLKYKLNEMEYNYEKVSKEIKEISIKLLSK